MENGERSPGETLDFVHPPILIIGLGNPILGDDGVGWRVAERVKNHLDTQAEGRDSNSDFPVEVDFLSLGGLSLMEHLIGFEHAIIIDAITTGNDPVGRVSCFPLEDLPTPGLGHLTSAHDTSLQTAIELGRSMDAKLPEQIMVVAVESQINYDFSESLSPEMEAAVPLAEKQVMQLLRKWQKTKTGG